VPEPSCYAASHPSLRFTAHVPKVPNIRLSCKAPAPSVTGRCVASLVGPHQEYSCGKLFPSSQPLPLGDVTHHGGEFMSANKEAMFDLLRSARERQQLRGATALVRPNSRLSLRRIRRQARPSLGLGGGNGRALRERAFRPLQNR